MIFIIINVFIAIFLNCSMYWQQKLHVHKTNMLPSRFHIISRQNCNMDEKAAVISKHMAAAKPKDLETEIMLSLQHVQQVEDQR